MISVVLVVAGHLRAAERFWDQTGLTRMSAPCILSSDRRAIDRLAGYGGGALIVEIPGWSIQAPEPLDLWRALEAAAAHGSRRIEWDWDRPPMAVELSAYREVRHK